VHISPRRVAVITAAPLLTSPSLAQAQVAPASPAPAAIAQSTTPLHTTANSRGTPDRRAPVTLRYRYEMRSYSNSCCGAANASCPIVDATGTSILGGLPLFKYNRAMLEYDF